MEELILAGADIIKVGIGPGDGRVVAANQRSPENTPHGSFYTFHRLCVHHP